MRESRGIEGLFCVKRVARFGKGGDQNPHPLQTAQRVRHPAEIRKGRDEKLEERSFDCAPRPPNCGGEEEARGAPLRMTAASGSGPCTSRRGAEIYVAVEASADELPAGRKVTQSVRT